MRKEIELKGTTIQYDLQYKSVKNINLRIRADASVCVSANRRTSQCVIEAFIRSKADFILKALQNVQHRHVAPKQAYFTESEIRQAVLTLCKQIYPYFEKRGVAYPVIKFRRMVSQWGNCRSTQGVLTFNTNLMYAPPACVEYVVAHEFTHFLQPNHSAGFYEELAKIMPDWKRRREALKGICLR